MLDLGDGDQDGRAGSASGQGRRAAASAHLSPGLPSLQPPKSGSLCNRQEDGKSTGSGCLCSHTNGFSMHHRTSPLPKAEEPDRPAPQAATKEMRFNREKCQALSLSSETQVCEHRMMEAGLRSSMSGNACRIVDDKLGVTQLLVKTSICSFSVWMGMFTLCSANLTLSSK